MVFTYSTIAPAPACVSFLSVGLPAFRDVREFDTEGRQEGKNCTVINSVGQDGPCINLRLESSQRIMGLVYEGVVHVVNRLLLRCMSLQFDTLSPQDWAQNYMTHA